ncbi:hypothetical protein RAM80_04670 [Pseudomonas sp. App30]|uniref:hypothetical protein n=1 Tax=Pseudomonas sp. App30 TaxID=3068990 RepID=UPI003A7FD591
MALLATFKVVIFHEKTESPFLLYLGCGLICAGFCLWLAKFVAWVVRHEFSRTVMTFVHAGVLLAAYVAARWVVALATGLPSKDFDGTIAVSAVVCALLLYVLLLSVVCFAIALGCVAAVSVSESAWLASRIPGAKLIRGWMEERMGVLFLGQPGSAVANMSLRFMAHFVAGILVTGFVGQGLQIAMNVTINDTQLMKHLAYYVDYQVADRYPGVEEGQRFVLHDNNVISLARLENGKVEIAVGVIEPLAGVTHLSAYR